ncbi:Acid phosphatase protein [Dioscorea alata]|uniref:Acid phosphatase protein n=1 Tax=Dioscorea alata TaxID=55571 RepID=A0ACB7U8E0_DIOAL|nr:Acid phosphatase protein [Dioscorea alata]
MAGDLHKPQALALVLMVIAEISLFFSIIANAELQRFHHPMKNNDLVSLLVIGDWGRNGNYNQSQVAAQMGKVGEELDIDFVISTGDNFYEDGLVGVHDNKFADSFTNIYTAKSLQKQWYSVLGNHDYRGDVVAQLSSVFRKIDNRWLCMRSFIVDTQIVEFFFVDTTPLVLKYWVQPEDHHYDWRDVAPRPQYVANLLKDLDAALKESTAEWKVVVGHHPIRSVSEHGDTEELLELLLPMLKANEVDLYLNGHDHCLEHISSIDSPIQYFTSGAGSKAWRGVRKQNADDLKFFYDGQGFMSMNFTKTDVKIVFYDVNGQSLYPWNMTKQLNTFM